MIDDDDDLGVYPTGDTKLLIVIDVLARAALVYGVMLIASPVWLPIAAYVRIKKEFEPRPTRRGTVSLRKAHAR